MFTRPIDRARFAAAKTIANLLGTAVTVFLFSSGLYVGVVAAVCRLAGVDGATPLLYFAGVSLAISTPILAAYWWRRLVKNKMRDMGY